MRVLYINDYSEPAGGAEHIWRRTAKFVRDRGLEVREFAADMVRTHRTPWSYVHSRAFKQAVERLVSDWRPDVVHLHNWYHHASPSVLEALAAARARGDTKAVVATAHDFHLLCPSPGLVSWQRGRPITFDTSQRLRLPDKVLLRWDEDGWVRSELRALQHVLAYDIRGLHRSLDLVLCPSRYLAESLAPLVHTEVLPNPVPSSVPVPPRQGPLKVLYAGRLVPEKGLVPFIHVAPASFLNRLVVVGTGREESAAKAAVSHRGLRTRFLGRVSHSRVLELASEANIVLMPSRWPENAPNTLFEALSRSATIIGSDMPGIREIVEEAGTGYLFDPSDPASIAAAVHQVELDHAAGTLNDFDVSCYLADRAEDRYVDRLIRWYEVLAGPS